MTSRDEIRDFLCSRRARLTPEQVGLPVFGDTRRVPGLRREEVSLLAGISVDYYVRLERGNLGGASAGVLEAIARALQLNEAERAHLFALAREAGPVKRRRRRPAEIVRPSVQSILDGMTGSPAYVRNGRRDVLATNALGYALYIELFRDPVRPVNHPRFVFLNPAATDLYPEWDRVAENTVALLRTEIGRNPHDQALSDLIDELRVRSTEFRTLWAAHDVRLHHAGTKRFRHSVVGDLTLSFEAMELAADPGLAIVAYSAEPGSRSAEGLGLLASWGATQGAYETVLQPEGS